MTGEDSDTGRPGEGRVQLVSLLSVSDRFNRLECLRLTPILSMVIGSSA